MKKIFSFLTIVVSMLLISGVVHAVDYNVWVQGTRVTSSNASNVLGNNTVSWDNANRTLTLNNATINAGNITQAAIRIGSSASDATFANKLITIKYLGTNTITSNNSDCISVYGDDVQVYITNSNTSGKLTLTGRWGIFTYGNGTETVGINQGSNSGFIKTNTQYTSVCTDNLIFANLSGSNNNFKATATDGCGIYCKSMYIGGNTAYTFADPYNFQNYSHNLTIDGQVYIENKEFDLNKQTTASNYIKTPTSAAIGKDGYVYDVKTGNKATKVVISNGVTRHNIWVKGVEVTSNNASNILGDGTVSYTASSNTLTLNGLQINMYDEFAYYGRTYAGQVAYIYYGEKAAANRKIELQGSNRADMYINGKRPCFIITDAENSGGADITFTGTGSMNMFLNNSSTASYFDYMLVSGNKYAKFIFQGSGRIWGNTYSSSKDKFANDSVIVKSTKYQTYWHTAPKTGALQCSNVVTTDFKAARGEDIRSIHMMPAYDLYLADVRVDEVNQNDIAARSSNISGTVSYVPASKTLSFNNATINYNGSQSYNPQSIIKNFGDLGGTSFTVYLTGTNNLTLTKNTTNYLWGFYYGVTFKGTGALNLTMNNTGTGTTIGIDGSTSVQGSGVITITTPNAGNNKAISGTITAASGYLMYSGATAGTATLKNPMPSSSSDKYIRFQRNTAATLSITDGPELDIPASVVGTPITNILLCDNVVGGTAPYQYTATGLPAGINIGASSGIISGTPTSTKSAGTATITVKDAQNFSASVTIAYGAVTSALTFTSNSAMNIPASTTGTAIASINCKTYVSGGVQPYTFSAFNLPAGITIAPSTGIISGTPTTAQPAGQAIITVTDANNTQKQVTINFGAVTAALTFTSSSAMNIPATTVGKAITAINCAPYVSGGTTPYTFSATGLPAGISIASSTGIISGTPTAVKAAGNVTITVKDAQNKTKSVTVSCGAVTAALAFTDNAAMDIPASTVGTAIKNINCKTYVSGGVQPYSFTATGLPAGIKINSSTGVISGTPTAVSAAGTATVKVTDGAGTSKQVTIAYGAISGATAPLTFTDDAAMDIPASIVGEAINDIDCAPYVSGGKAPYTFSATGLPAGISIDASTGWISGAPTTAAPAGTATIKVTDGNGTSKSITINYGEISEPTGVDNVSNDELLVWGNNGFIGCSEDEYTIYTINGVDVTTHNGNLLPGTYVVRSANSAVKITIK